MVGGVDALLVADSDDVVSVSGLLEVVVGESMGDCVSLCCSVCVAGVWQGWW